MDKSGWRAILQCIFTAKDPPTAADTMRSVLLRL